ncbi:hypothetical protein Tco_1029884 [Tanacetum coccineum]|uniref:Uncharacterized protein n=1 Tax=Tanacetum coccineum TaxID=301880 RepID=A0ABQ5G686_9ASTR
MKRPAGVGEGGGRWLCSSIHHSSYYRGRENVGAERGRDVFLENSADKVESGGCGGGEESVSWGNMQGRGTVELDSAKDVGKETGGELREAWEGLVRGGGRKGPEVG